VVHSAVRLRLLRRCLLFGLLGLVTAVAVAWGLSLPWRLRGTTAGPMGVGLAAKGDTIIRVRVRSYTGGRFEVWEFTDNTLERGLIGPRPGDAQKIAEMGGAAYDEWMEQIERFRVEIAGTAPRPPQPEQYRIDDRAERGSPVAVPDLARGETEVWIRSSGWPFLLLRYIERSDRIMDDSNVARNRTELAIGARTVDWQTSSRFKSNCHGPRSAAPPPAAPRGQSRSPSSPAPACWSTPSSTRCSGSASC
jgi:hypothetical protein